MDVEMTLVENNGPLAGVKVVEMSVYVQGPVAGLTLASLGADVVKIEQVGRADHMRAFRSAFGVDFDDRGREWMYASVNRNKRALALDVVSEAGRPVFERLVEQADVFITNLRESGLARFRADPETLMAINPRLVYCRGAGFGLRGPMADDPCQDTVGMAYAGFMDSTSPNDVPNYPPGSMSDILTGSNLASGAMAGLLRRGITGKGCVVGTSQTQALLWMQLQAVGVAANMGTRMERFAHDATSNPLFTVYQTADGWIAIAAIQSSHWPVIARAVGRADLLEDPRFADFRSVIANRDEFRAVFVPHMLTQTTAHWWQALRAAGAWVAPVNRLEDLPFDENILANEYLTTFDDGFIGPPAPFEVDGFKGVRGLAASYGEHSDEILSELGYSDEEIVDLRLKEAIW
jgi:crotonobetainyl-CoA:carnitine CoA-transferase CaiB-like acyl-CoA transferase